LLRLPHLCQLYWIPRPCCMVVHVHIQQSSHKLGNSSIWFWEEHEQSESRRGRRRVWRQTIILFYHVLGTRYIHFLIEETFYYTKVGVTWVVKVIDVEVKCIYHIILKNWNPWILTFLVNSWLTRTTQYTHQCDAMIYRVLICNTISIMLCIFYFNI